MRRVLGTAALVAGSFLVGGLVLEAALRAIGYEPPRFRNTG